MTLCGLGCIPSLQARPISSDGAAVVDLDIYAGLGSRFEQPLSGLRGGSEAVRGGRRARFNIGASLHTCGLAELEDIALSLEDIALSLRYRSISRRYRIISRRYRDISASWRSLALDAEICSVSFEDIAISFEDIAVSFEDIAISFEDIAVS